MKVRPSRILALTTVFDGLDSQFKHLTSAYCAEANTVRTFLSSLISLVRFSIAFNSSGVMIQVSSLFLCLVELFLALPAAWATPVVGQVVEHNRWFVLVEGCQGN